MSNKAKPAVAYYVVFLCVVESENTILLQNITVGRVVFGIFSFREVTH